MPINNDVSKPVWRKRVYLGILVLAISMGIYEGLNQYLEDMFVSAVAHDVIEKAGASDSRSRVIALRDYIRAHITFEGAPYEDRPFLRATAAETLQSGRGYCGEGARAFICLADSVGIRAQRINLWGTEPHVVAEAEISPHDRVVVDSQNPPKITDLETLDRVILRPEFTDYYTLNLRRMHLNGIVSRVKLEMGPLTYWTENPHAMKALLWFLLVLSLALSLLILKSARNASRILLRRRGWIHVSNTQQIAAAATMLKQNQQASGEQPSTNPAKSLTTPVTRFPLTSVIRMFTQARSKRHNLKL